MKVVALVIFQFIFSYFIGLYTSWYPQFWSFFKLFFKNIWREKKIVLPLHSLLRTNVLDKLKKEFFEKIYINREVVQEARHIAICVLGRRNEPINSSNVNEGFKEWSFCFFAFLFCYFQFTFLLLNQGDSFWTDYSRYEWLIECF